MDAITLRLEEETIESLEDEADEHGVSRSEYIRELICTRDEHERLRDEYEAQISEYENRIANLELQVERLENEKRLILEQREEHTDLVRYVEDEIAYREAGLATRAKWWLFGKNGE